MRAFVFIAGLTVASVANAQSVRITISHDDADGVLALGQSATITVTAEVTGAAAFAGWWFDVSHTPGRIGAASGGVFHNDLGALSPPPWPSTFGYTSVQTANFPIAFGGTDLNPVVLFSYSLRGTETGVVEIDADTNPWSDVAGARVYLHLDDIAATPADVDVVGTSLRVIVPSPASPALLGLWGLAAARRRR